MRATFFILFFICFSVASKAEPLQFEFFTNSFEKKRFHTLIMDADVFSAVQTAIEAVKVKTRNSFEFNSISFSKETNYVRVTLSNVGGNPLAGPIGPGLAVAMSKTDLKVLWIKNTQ